MPRIDTTAPNAGGDALDNAIDDFDVDKIFDSLEQNAQTASTGQTATDKPKTDALGLANEIKVRKNRKPVPKLDENLLLSEKGIPKLRRLTREKLKFKGKGHEFSDIERMLNMYQLWLDDLYPRAKFLDSIAMVEKAGHSKRIQVMRKEWINESKPRDSAEQNEEAATHSPENGADVQMVNGNGNDTGEVVNGDMEGASRNAENRRNSNDLFLTDDEADDLRPASTNQRDQPQPQPQHDYQPPDDELDALLAEENTLSAPAPLPSTGDTPVEHQQHQPHDDFADDMEAMAEMDMW